MLRRFVPCIGLALLLFAPGCKKKSDEAKGDDEAADSGQAAKQPEQPAVTPPTPEPTPEPVAPAETGGEAADSGGGAKAGSGGGSGGAAPTPREDLTCDPLEKGACLEGEQCIGAQGCDAVWTCDATIVCHKGVKEYCGCDGRTFEAVYGNCPWKKYKYAGPCK